MRAHLRPGTPELDLGDQCLEVRVGAQGVEVAVGEDVVVLVATVDRGLQQVERFPVTALVDRLESRGLVQRQPSAEDRRVKVLVLTDTGARVRAVLVERLGARRPAFERLTDQERQTLIRLLERLLDE